LALALYWHGRLGRRKREEGREKIHWTSAFSSSLWDAKTTNGGCNGISSTLQPGRLAATSRLVVA